VSDGSYAAGGCASDQRRRLRSPLAYGSRSIPNKTLDIRKLTRGLATISVRLVRVVIPITMLASLVEADSEDSAACLLDRGSRSIELRSPRRLGICNEQHSVHHLCKDHRISDRQRWR
jgi:hypothetical protein